MSRSLIIVALVLFSMQHSAYAQKSPFTVDRQKDNVLPENLLMASGGNPWALPESKDQSGYPDYNRRPAQRNDRGPRYITPEELEKLRELPEEQKSYGTARGPMGWNRGYFSDAAPAGPASSVQGGYPPPGGYGYPPYGGDPSLYDPYSGPVGAPYGGILPFLY